ncbi:hypothetical protein FH972_021982 [Carpinus fangiana]|uniref:mitogen-activated protein kinase kinase kinase n=1 Tax=Carpinus fangiana TaxID=176857 RepID=A0A5N6KQX5_9ROSI|nr:hypothetical protein FH972_021982 [Carpinus fangiana]
MEAEDRYTASHDRYDDAADGQDLRLGEDEDADNVAPLRDSAIANAYTQANGSPNPNAAYSTSAYDLAQTSNAPSVRTPQPQQQWPRGNAPSSLSTVFDSTGQPLANGSASTPRTPRPPNPSRTPSHAYAPPRRPSQYILSSSKHRSSSSHRTRLNPDADYRAQKRAYAQRLQQDNMEEMDLPNGDYPPGLAYSTGSETEDESPSTADQLDDPYDQEAMMYYGNEDNLPSLEDLKVPANRERLEWHSMLSNVLTGDVVRQEKKRMTGGTEQQGDNSLATEMWLGIRARVCGRAVPAQKRMVEDQRSKIPALLEEIITFEIKGEAEVGKSARAQVEDIVKKIEKVESLYPTRLALETAYPRASSQTFKESYDAVVAWHNTTALINTELGILQSWVGNDELDFSKPRERSSTDNRLSDDASFIDRVLKEDGLKSLMPDEKDPEKTGLLGGVEKVISKAKVTLIENADQFASRHLPPYIEELLTLINFPSRLVQEIIRMRLSYAKKVREQAQQTVMMAEQMINQFRILLELAVKTKEAYTIISQPEAGWDLPSCIDENFDSVVLEALKFYFKMLSVKLFANKNTFKEAEVLEQEWMFSSELGRHFDGGDVEVAEQFGKLTSKSLASLTAHFERELQRKPNEVAGAEMDRRYKQILDSVRVRQRKLFRFSRLLTQTFENASDYSINMDSEHVAEFVEALVMTGHLLITPSSKENDKLWLVASPNLQNRPRDVQAILTTAYRADVQSEDPSFPYVLVINPEETLEWDGHRQKVDMRIPKFDLKQGKLRLISEGTQHILQAAKNNFAQTIGSELDILVPQRANIPGVDSQLRQIKRTAYKLSNTIMDSVELIRKQLSGLDCQELIQTCFAFATEFGQRSVLYMDQNRRALNNLKLTRLALDWVSFICDDCIASERKTFRWAVVALEFAMVMTRGQNILSITDEEYAKLRAKVAGCMSLLISHFDIMGARSTVAAQAEKQRIVDTMGGKFKLDISKLKDDEESMSAVRRQWTDQLSRIDEIRNQQGAERQPVGRVIEESNEADRSLTFLSASATNVSMRWQQGQYIGGGAFGSVYAAINLDSGLFMAVKEIRLQDPQLIPSIISQIRDEMSVLQILDHPNIVSYYGIEVHRDKVYIFMEYCSGGSLANLLEHGRIEDETVIQVYALQMLEGLAYLHESGVVHRDIKPENILLDHNGVIKYVDFGAAKVIARQTGRTLATNDNAPQRQGRQKSMTGTPMYMSPEVIRGSSASIPGVASNSPSNSPTTSPARHGAVDTWSLGCVVLEMATGRRPWASLDNEWAIMYNIAQGNPPQLPTPDQLSESGIDFLKKCFEKDPSRRASAVELLQHEWIMALRAQIDLSATTPQTPSSTGPMTPGSESNSGSSVGSGGGTSGNVSRVVSTNSV